MIDQRLTLGAAVCLRSAMALCASCNKRVRCFLCILPGCDKLQDIITLFGLTNTEPTPPHTVRSDAAYIHTQLQRHANVIYAPAMPTL